MFEVSQNNDDTASAIHVFALVKELRPPSNQLTDPR
jgi:hypothetical protein